MAPPETWIRWNVRFLPTGMVPQVIFTQNGCFHTPWPPGNLHGQQEIN